MKHQQPTLRRVIGTTAGIATAYWMSVLIEAQAGMILGLLGLSIVATVWMAIAILKAPYSTDKTFDSHFYQDREDIRRNGTE